MTTRQSKVVKSFRQASQILFVAVFFYLFLSSGNYSDESIENTSVFFYFDPFIALTNFLTSGELLTIFLFSSITILLTFIFGRFFCGWVCPFGTINHFFSWLLKKSNNEKELLNKKMLKAKYLILISLLVAAVMGTNIGGWLDPISLLTRSAAALVSPVEYLINKPINAVIQTGEKAPSQSNPVQELNKESFYPKSQNLNAQPFLIAGLFIFIIIINVRNRRFYCNTICPLGTFLGLISRFSLFRVNSTPECISCNQCTANCSYNGNPDDEFIRSECNVCFNCSTDCPSDAVEYIFQFTRKESSKEIDLGRRKMLGAAAAGLVVAALSNSSIDAKEITRHSFLRPPGSADENEFLDKCLRCGQCVQSCPTSFIQPALVQTGLGGIWTPVLNSKAGYCIFDCNNCTQVCPSEAIIKLSLKQKQVFKIGTAVIDKNRCYTYADGMNCTICEEACPTPEKAIQFRNVSTWNFQGKLKQVNQIYVIPHLCIGCGICEYICPRTDHSGIVITAEDEIRERITGDL